MSAILPAPRAERPVSQRWGPRSRCPEQRCGAAHDVSCGGNIAAMDYLVSRHMGALAWMRHRLGAQAHETRQHLDASFRPQPGDRVLGVLPLAWVERICRAGAEAWVLEVEVPPQLRGQELSAEQLDALGASLVRYEARRLPPLAKP